MSFIRIYGGLQIIAPNFLLTAAAKKIAFSYFYFCAECICIIARKRTCFFADIGSQNSYIGAVFFYGYSNAAAARAKI